MTSLSFTGIIGAVAKDFFNSDITMEIVNQLEELERTGKKEHVVFLVTQWPDAVARSSVASSKTGLLPRTQSLQPLANRRNAMIWIKEVRLKICVTSPVCLKNKQRLFYKATYKLCRRLKNATLLTLVKFLSVSSAPSSKEIQHQFLHAQKSLGDNQGAGSPWERYSTDTQTLEQQVGPAVRHHHQ